MRRLAASILGCVLFCAGNACATDWPRFRGPQGMGDAGDAAAPVEWGPEQNVRWKTALPGPGNGSPIVSAGRVLLTTAEDQGRRRNLHCFDRATGQELWTRTVEYPEVELTHGTNPHAGTTPVADGETVVVWHGSAGIFCYDLDGKELWQRDLGEFRHIWGFGSSPILWKDRVILNAGPGPQQRLMALDRATGEVVWETPEPGGASGEEKDPKAGWIGSWSTPVVVELGGQEQILCTQPSRVVGYDPSSGKMLWNLEGLANPPAGNLAYASPIIGDGIAVILGGFHSPAFAFRFGENPKVTEEDVLWRHEQRNPQRIGSGVIIDGYLYQANAGPNTVECLDARTGEQQWVERLGASATWGSIVQAGGKLYVTDQRGTTHVFLPNPKKFERIASNDLSERSNSTPAISDGEIFIKTDKHLYCIGGR